MKEDTERRLWPKYEKVLGYFRAMSGADSYEQAIKALQAECSDKKASPAPWLHKKAREIYQTDEPDAVQPELFSEILTEIDSLEKARGVFANLPEEKVPQIEAFLDFLLKRFFPQQKSNAKRMGKVLPQRHDGGPTPKMPSEEDCRTIYDEVEELAKRVKRGVPQRRLADRKGLSLRMVQRICRAQRESLSGSQSDAADSCGE
jgi:hypothetical protein